MMSLRQCWKVNSPSSFCKLSIASKYVQRISTLVLGKCLPENSGGRFPSREYSRSEMSGSCFLGGNYLGGNFPEPSTLSQYVFCGII